KPSRCGTPMTAVGWNCRNSRSARSAPAACASPRPIPSDPGGFVVRDQSAAAVLEDDAETAVLRRVQRGGARPLEHGDARMPGGQGGEVADDAPAGRAAAGVGDPAPRVTALQAEREPAVGVDVEADTELEEVADLVRRLVDEHARRGRAHGA